jgi:hypothetical protein
MFQRPRVDSLPMEHSPEDVRRAFVDAVSGFLETAALIDESNWDSPATDQWSVIELFAHTARGLAFVVDYLEVEVGPGQIATINSASDYFRAALSTAGVHQGIAERATNAVARYRPDPVGSARTVAQSVLERVASTSDERVMKVFVEFMRFIDYLETRTVELVLHTFDLQLALGLMPTSSPSSLRVVADLLLDLADRADPIALALAISGRSSALRCSVLD